jgi:hypothetical protein
VTTGEGVARLIGACQEWVEGGMPDDVFPPALAELSQPDRDMVLGGVREFAQVIHDRMAGLETGREVPR